MLVTLEELVNIRKYHPRKRIVLTSGTYDLFHVGHLRYLNKLKSADTIVVMMVSNDLRVKRRKGAGRPIIPEADRAELLDGLKAIDYVFIDPSEVPPGQVDPIYGEVVDRLRPDTYVTYCHDGRFPTFLDTSKLIIAPRVAGGSYNSSTAIIRHIINTQRPV